MVDLLLLIVAAVSIVIWFAQEKFARPQLQGNLDKLIASGNQYSVDHLQTETMPGWNECLFKLVALLWLGWVASIVLIKDGDFAFVLVILTLLAGLIVGLDKLIFEGARRSYLESKAVVDYLGKYTAEQRDWLKNYIGQDMIVGEYCRSFFPVLAFVLVLRSFIIEPFQIPSASMVPSLLVGDYILVNKYTYGLRLPVLGTKVLEVGEPERGDVMVFFPPHQDIYFIKRVIGVPGDEIRYQDKQLFVNGEKVEQTLLAELPPLQPQVELANENLTGVNHLIYKSLRVNRFDDFTETVKPGHYWMMGDNRDNSSDSRIWGQVPEENIVGKAFAIWLHWPSITDVPSFSRLGKIQ